MANANITQSTRDGGDRSDCCTSTNVAESRDAFDTKNIVTHLIVEITHGMHARALVEITHGMHARALEELAPWK